MILEHFAAFYIISQPNRTPHHRFFRFSFRSRNRNCSLLQPHHIQKNTIYLMGGQHHQLALFNFTGWIFLEILPSKCQLIMLTLMIVYPSDPCPLPLGMVKEVWAIYVKVAKDLKHRCFFLKKLISRQREASQSASFNLIPITHNIKGLYVQICRGGSPGGEI